MLTHRGLRLLLDATLQARGPAENESSLWKFRRRFHWWPLVIVKPILAGRSGRNWFLAPKKRMHQAYYILNHSIHKDSVACRCTCKQLLRSAQEPCNAMLHLPRVRLAGRYASADRALELSTTWRTFIPAVLSEMHRPATRFLWTRATCAPHL